MTTSAGSHRTSNPGCRQRRTRSSYWWRRLTAGDLCGVAGVQSRHRFRRPVGRLHSAGLARARDLSSPGRPARATRVRPRSSLPTGRRFRRQQAHLAQTRLSRGHNDHSLRLDPQHHGLTAQEVPYSDPSSVPRLRSPTQGEYTYVTPKVYSWCMTKVRTNIEIEDSYVEAVMHRYGVRTKTEAVDLALRHLAGQPMTREEALAMRGANAIGETPSEVSPTPAT